MERIIFIIIAIFTLIFVLFILTGCNIEEDAKNNDDKEMYLAPMFLPSSNGQIRMVMMPRIRDKEK